MRLHAILLSLLFTFTGWHAKAEQAASLTPAKYTFVVREKGAVEDKYIILPSQGLTLEVLKTALKDKDMSNAKIEAKMKKHQDSVLIHSNEDLQEFLSRTKARIQLVYLTVES